MFEFSLGDLNNDEDLVSDHSTPSVALLFIEPFVYRVLVLVLLLVASLIKGC